MKRHRQTKGLTLTELLVVISIIVLVTGVMVPLMRPITEGQPMKEAARIVSSAFAGAQIEAISKQKPVGIWISREISNTDQDQDTFRAFKLFQAEQPHPYSGDFDNVQLTLARQPDPDFDPARFPVPIWVGNQTLYLSVARYGFALLGELASSQRIIQVGDEIRFEYRNQSFSIVDVRQHQVMVPIGGTPTPTSMIVFTYVDPQGLTDKYIDMVTPTFRSRRALPFQIIRQPRKTSAQPIEMPKGTAIDLSLSGIASDVDTSLQPIPRFRYSFDQEFILDGTGFGVPTQFFRPDVCPEHDIVIMYGPDGEVDKVHYLWNGYELLLASKNKVPPISDYCRTLRSNFNITLLPQKRDVIGPIHLFLGREDKIGLNALEEPQTALDPNTGFYETIYGEANLRDTNNIWLTITGNRVTTSPNAGVSKLNENTPLNYGNFGPEFQHSRQFTNSGLSLGGN